MSVWLIAHAPYIGIACIGFLGGVVFAAWRQMSLESAQ